MNTNIINNYKWTTMKKPLKYSVLTGTNEIAIPAGTENVKIAFNQSNLVRNNTTGRIYRLERGIKTKPNEQRLNVYLNPKNNELIYAQ